MTGISTSKLKEFPASDTKPEKLAKIMYEGIVRYIKARNARNKEKKPRFELDSDHKQRVNVVTRN
jgi:hypothetical protein